MDFTEDKKVSGTLGRENFYEGIRVGGTCEVVCTDLVRTSVVLKQEYHKNLRYV